jgi:hypothetical protein
MILKSFVFDAPNVVIGGVNLAIKCRSHAAVGPRRVASKSDR